MKTKIRRLPLLVIVLILGACCPLPNPDTGLGNPASKYCEGLGYTLEMRTDADGGTYGVCVFPDGSECEEWAFYRGECGPSVSEGEPEDTPQPSSEPTLTPEEVVWVNIVRQANLGSTVEIEILELDLEASAGAIHRLTISDSEAIAQIVGLLDGDVQLRPVDASKQCPGRYMLRFHLADGSVQEIGLGCDVENLDSIHGAQPFWQGRDAEPPAQLIALIQSKLAAVLQEGTPVRGWYGYVVSPPEVSEYDGILVLEPEGVGELGVVGADESVTSRIVALRDDESPNKYVHFWGTLVCESDGSKCHLLVTRLRTGTEITEREPVEGWDGLIISEPPMSQYDDHFVLSSRFLVIYGITSLDPAVAAQLQELRDTMTPVRVWGEMACGVPDVNGCVIEVTRVDIIGDPLVDE